MITEDYVSFEIAKLLKEKGFDENCNMAFFNETLVDYTMFGFCTGGDLLYCPTLQMAMKWLREVHDVHLAPFPYDFENGAVRYLPEILIISNETQQPEYVEGLNICKSYEQAVEAAIKYALENLIQGGGEQ